MDIVCPKCNKLHKIADDEVPARKAAAKCKICGSWMVINSKKSKRPSSAPPPPMEMPAAKRNPFNNTGEITWHENGQGLELLSQYGEHILSRNSDEGNDPEDLSVLGQELLGDGDSERMSISAEVDKNSLFAVFPRLHDFDQTSFCFEDIFTLTEKPGYKTSKNRLKFRLIETVYSLLLNRILIEGERVHKVSRGILYYPFEIPYANGLLTVFSNYFAIFCTNHRLLFVNIDFRGKKIGRYVYQVLYEEIVDVSRSIFLTSLKIKTKSKRNWNFTSLGKSSAKEIKDYLLNRGKNGPSGLFNGVTRWQLCPICDKFLSLGLASCPHCSAMFKRSDEAMTRSLILPGLGSVYLSYIPLGIVEMAAYLTAWFAAIVLLILKVPGGVTTAVLMVISCHLLAAFLARKNALKGYLLEPTQFPSVQDYASGDDLKAD